MRRFKVVTIVMLRSAHFTDVVVYKKAHLARERQLSQKALVTH